MIEIHSSEAVLAFGAPGAAAEGFQYSRAGKRPFEDVLIALRAAIEAAGMRVLHEIDPQKALAGAGQTIDGSRLLFFFHPDLVVRVMRADWSAMVEAPLKLVVTELPDGTVSVRMADPALAFGRYGNAALAALGRELAAACETIIGASL